MTPDELNNKLNRMKEMRDKLNKLLYGSEVSETFGLGALINKNDKYKNQLRLREMCVRVLKIPMLPITEDIQKTFTDKTLITSMAYKEFCLRCTEFDYDINIDLRFKALSMN